MPKKTTVPNSPKPAKASKRVVKRTKFGARLHDIRVGAGLDIEQLSKRSGISYSLCAKLEGPAGNPTLSTLVAISKGLKTTASKLVEGL